MTAANPVVPDSAVEKAARAIFADWYGDLDLDSVEEADQFREAAALALAAALPDLIAANTDKLRVDLKAVADQWRCTCDPGPEGQHREGCAWVYGETIRVLLTVVHPTAGRAANTRKDDPMSNSHPTVETQPSDEPPNAVITDGVIRHTHRPPCVNGSVCGEESHCPPE